MNLLHKKFIWFFAFFTFGLLSVMHVGTAQAASDEVRVQINDNLMTFPDAKPFIDGSSNLQVPLRLLMEQLGYQMDWSKNEQAIQVTLSSKTQKVVLQTGDPQALVNGKTIKLESPPLLSQQLVYVPLRFVTETFGYQIQWDAVNKLAIIDADGLYHAPAWYAPKASASILQSAFNYLGVPYVWGGSSPNGFDCSGYVGYIFQLSGVYLPRTSAQMYSSAGTRVSEIQEGDLVFFAEGRKTSHVGIYIGNDQFISATTYGGVTVASLNSGYWGSKYIGAKRL